MTKKKIAQYMRLTNKHPTMIKLMKLYDLAEELGIRIIFSNYGDTVADRDLPNDHPLLRVEDTDSGEPIGQWPPVCDFKVIFENPKWAVEQQRIWEEEMRATKLAREKEEAEAKQRELDRQQAIERRERAELATLKQKYGE